MIQTGRVLTRSSIKTSNLKRNPPRLPIKFPIVVTTSSIFGCLSQLVSIVVLVSTFSRILISSEILCALIMELVGVPEIKLLFSKLTIRIIKAISHRLTRRRSRESKISHLLSKNWLRNPDFIKVESLIFVHGCYSILGMVKFTCSKSLMSEQVARSIRNLISIKQRRTSFSLSWPTMLFRRMVRSMESLRRVISFQSSDYSSILLTILKCHKLKVKRMRN